MKISATTGALMHAGRDGLAVDLALVDAGQMPELPGQEIDMLRKHFAELDRLLAYGSPTDRTMN